MDIRVQENKTRTKSDDKADIGRQNKVNIKQQDNDRISDSK